MYSCEKLARGRSGKFTKNEPHKIYSYRQTESFDIKVPIRRHAFSHIEEYQVSIEEYQDRPRGIMQSQVSSIQYPSLVKTKFGRRK